MIPPHDIDAERAVLGALLLNVASEIDASDAYASLQPASFYRRQHGAIFAAARDLHQERIEVDELTVVDKLKARGELDAAGGAAVVSELADAAPSGANLPHYARMVRGHWQRRQLIAVGQEAVTRALDLERPVQEVLDGIAESISTVSLTTVRHEPRTFRSLVRESFKRLQVEASADEEILGVQTGFWELDDFLCGLRPGQFILLAGRPSMGKTAMGLAMARNAALNGDVTTLVSSLEMESRELVERELAAAGHINSQSIRRPKRLSDDEWSRLVEAVARLDSERLLICDTPAQSVLDIRAQARLTKARHGLGLLVVDYLGLIMPSRRDDSREREISELSSGLKNLAKELQVPVLCLAQLNRESERRNDKRPMLADLRGSGSLEQDADVVMFVHRPHYYDPKQPADITEILIAKQRNGRTGKVEVGWDARFVKFYNHRTAPGVQS